MDCDFDKRVGGDGWPATYATKNNAAYLSPAELIRFGVAPSYASKKHCRAVHLGQSPADVVLKKPYSRALFDEVGMSLAPGASVVRPADPEPDKQRRDKPNGG